MFPHILNLLVKKKKNIVTLNYRYMYSKNGRKLQQLSEVANLKRVRMNKLTYLM